MGASGSDQGYCGDKTNLESTAPSHGSEPGDVGRPRLAPLSASLDPDVNLQSQDFGEGREGTGEETKEGERRTRSQEEVTAYDVLGWAEV